jgi:hypothetical protein
MFTGKIPQHGPSGNPICRRPLPMKSLSSSHQARFGRRSFLKTIGCAAAAFPWVCSLAAAAPAPLASPLRSRSSARELSADLVIIGGGLGGCAAALAAARNGLNVIMTEETDWIGGQLTQQAVPPDENKWIETVGGTRSFQNLRAGIREYYRRHYPLTDAARANPLLSPGNCWVSRLGAEPRVALAVLNEMFAPLLGSGRVRVLLNHKPVSASVQGDRVLGVEVLDTQSGRKRVLCAPFFADATEQGDLLPLTRTEYSIGAEGRSETGEPHAKDKPEPDNLQGFTFCFAMDYLPGEDHTISRPRDYSLWRDYQINLAGQAPYRLVSFEEEGSKKVGFDPELRKGFWTYRRIADRDLFQSGFYRSDLTIVNWPQNDYSFGRICDVREAEAKKHLDRAKQLSRSLLYWLQTDAPRPDGSTGWKGLRLRPDVVGTGDGMAKYPYIREGRRIKAEFTVLEQHVNTEARMAETGQNKTDVRAMPFPDSVGIGSYHMDLHLTTRGDQAQYGSTLPFQIPLGALLPRRVENLLPAGKNLGVTHLTNGCYRVHTVEWNVGEAAGTLAAFCAARKQLPRAVRHQADLLADYQKLLLKDGVRLDWPPEAGPI